ncbi:hypothetical protein [Mesorhizobium sp. L48C026A00]|uniref:hypothetical protein n=1 Tax=Mesorhizobium sp. L48C026A00 TaxID=1287182 RepID=UPI0003CFF996|nr:hypothetical protein [Mesorhizobium sp. L48C026A00]ESZ11916.1 hypothetical protein X737_29010 [Mesorhizobium sp. L48C026A00]
MNTARKYIVAGVSLVALSASVFSNSASVIEATRVKIASSSHREVGCSESTASFKTVIPNFEKLDTGFQGALAGIEVVVRERNGTASYGNLTFTDGGAAVTYNLRARGAGTRLRMPWGGGNVCQRAEGANISIEIFAHYKAGNA